MAVITPAFSKVRGPSGGIDAVIIKWGPMTNGDTCVPVLRPDLADKSFQVEGSAFGGASMSMTGSNDSTTGSDGHFEILSIPSGTAATISTAGAIVQITEATRWIAPAISGGAGSSLTATVCARRSMR